MTARGLSFRGESPAPELPDAAPLGALMPLVKPRPQNISPSPRIR
jgi:hypothetical protein